MLAVRSLSRAYGRCLKRCLSDAAREVGLLRFATQVEAFVFGVAGAALCDVTKVQI